MKALFKKPIAVILAALLLLTAFPLTATAATTAEQSVGATSGTTGSCTWTLDGDGTLTISGNGAMGNYSSTYYNNGTRITTAPWGANIKSVVIKNGVISIGNYAFSGCTGLTSVTIPDSVTSIGDDAFYGCTGLTSVTIPDSVTSIGSSAFEHCTGLTSVTIPDSVTSIGYAAFYGCTGLTSVTIPDSVTSIGSSAFSGCKGLTGITIPDSVTSIGYSAFSGCTGLTSVTIPDSVTYIGGFAFNGCTNLANISISDQVPKLGQYAFTSTAWFNKQPSGIVYLGKYAYYFKGTIPKNIVIKEGTIGIAECAFYSRKSFASLTIPDSVTYIGDLAFSGCTGLTSVTIPDSVTSIGYSAFEGCTGLTSVTIGNGVTSIGSYAFRNCTGLKRITIPNSVTSIGDKAFGYYQDSGYKKIPGFTIYGVKGSKAENYANNNKIKFVNINDYPINGTTANCTWTLSLDGTLTISGNGAIADYTQNSDAPWGTDITSVVIGNGVSSIGKYAFSGCENLASVTIPGSVTSIGEYAFRGCTGLKGVYITDLAAWCNIKFSSNSLSYAYNLYLNNQRVTDLVIPDSVTSIRNYAFRGCKGLTSITIPDSVKSIGDYAFEYCTGLTSVTIPDSVTSIGDYAFEGCEGLTSVTIPDSVTSIGDYAFYGCTGLENVTIGNSVTSIGNYAFKYCTRLTSVTIPDSVTSIGSSAFEDCTGLTSVTIPDSVTSIGSYAFYECSRLTSITIPDSVTSIGNYAFKYCTGLTSVTIGNSVTNIGEQAFKGCTGLTSVTIPDSVASIGNYAFSGCTGLTSVTITDSVASIGNYAFSGCTGLTSVTITDSVTSIGESAFNGCTGLTGVYISDLAAWCNTKFTDNSSNPLYYAHKLYLNNQLVTNLVIPDGVKSIGTYTFSGCTSLKSVTVSGSVKSIGGYAFKGCTGLTDINFSNGLVSIGGFAFEGTKLKTLIFPHSLDYIGYSAFSGCTGLTSVTIPNSASSIGDKAFYNCYNLTIYGLTGSTAESYADNFGINFVSLDDMPTEPTTVEPTTAEPTTEEPTTEEPTTEQPDIPQKTDVTIKLAAPVSTFASRYTWNDAVFYYGDTSNFDDLTKVSMTDTGEKFYTTGTFNSTIITPGAWKIYSVTLTAEQIQAVDASKFAGFATSDNVNRTKLAKNANVFSAATGEYANYSSAASGAGGFDGKTFVFANASYGSTSPISYMGYWINSYVTVKAAAPMANTSYSRWDSMQLYYGNTAALADMETVDLFNTKETTKVTNSGDMTIKNGRWYIYAITLTDTQANAVDSAAYVGFKKAGAENRTSIMMNVLKAKTNSFDGTYGAKRTLNDLEGQVFVISGQTKTGISVATYVGQWKTRDVYTAGDNDEITIYFAVPNAVKAVDSWDTGVEFYYSNENSYKDAARMQMTPEPDYDIYSDFSGETFEQGSCSVYSLTIPAVKVREIDECKKVGFVKKGSYNRTYYAQGYAVTRASSVSDNQSYGLPQSIEAFDGNIFVITGCTDPNNERVTYTGWWN